MNMISPQARITKRIIKLGNSSLPRITTLERQRLDFEKNMRILFPTVSNRLVKKTTIAGVPVEMIAPSDAANRTIIYVHGGGFALGSSRAYRQHLVRLAKLCRAKVLSVEYDLAPEHPYPHAANQVYAVWRALTAQKDFNPSKIALTGDSAGANIIMAAVLRLRSEELPLPACLVLLSAALDATFSGESYSKNKHTDIILSPEAIDFYMKAYVQESNKKDSSISPIFADLRGFPPMLIHVGSEELLLSSSVTLFNNAKANGVSTRLFIGEGMWHNWHLFAGFVPEARQAMREVSQYIIRQTD